MTMKQLSYVPDANSLNYIESASNQVDVRALAAGVAKSFTKPTGVTSIGLNVNPGVGDVITFGSGITGAGAGSSYMGTQITFVAANPTSVQMVPLGTLALTLAALATQLQTLSISPAGTFSVLGNAIVLTNTVSAVPTSVNYFSKAGSSVAIQQTPGAQFARLSAGTLFYYSAAVTATITAVDQTTVGSISVPATVQPMFNLDDVTLISVISPTICQVSCEWWS